MAIKLTQTLTVFHVCWRMVDERRPAADPEQIVIIPPFLMPKQWHL
jgi:hypothetical protein